MFISPFAHSADGSIQRIVLADYEEHVELPMNMALAEGITAADSIKRDCELARKGVCSVKSLIRNSNSYVAFGALRSESDVSKIPGAIYSSGDHFLYSFSFRIDDEWIDLATEKDSLDIFWQFKKFGSGPDMFLAVKNNSVVWRIAEHDQIVLLSPAIQGDWIDFDFDVKWSDQGDGVAKLKVVVAGAKPREFQFRGRNMRAAGSKSGTVQWGLYKPGDREKFTFKVHSVHHDEINISRVLQ
jgi:hypothetical protein